MSNARLAVIIAVLVFFGWLVYLLAPVLTPFVVAALLAYVSNPIVRSLGRLHVPRVLAVIIVFVLFTAVLLGLVLYLVPLLSAKMAALIAHIPDYVDWLVAQLPRLEEGLGVSLKVDINTLRDSLSGHWREVAEWATRALDIARQSGLTVIGWLVNLLLIPLVTFYLLLDWEKIIGHVDSLVPPVYRERVRSIAAETDAVLASFLRGQLSVMLSLATIYSIGLFIVGLDLALPIGLLAGAVSFVPYLGFITGLVSAGIAGYVQFHDAWILLWVAAVFVGGQLIDATFLTPRLVGRRIGLHPVAVIFALMAGGQLFGFFGVLIALPTAAALKVWLRRAHDEFMRAPARMPARLPTRPRKR